MPTIRRIGATTYTTPTDRELVATRVFDAPRTLVFDAWTKPEHLRNWMLGPQGWTMPVCEIDLRAGGAWHFVWRQADGTEMGMQGTYLDVVPPERIVISESWGGDWPETQNTVTFTEEGGKTTMTMTILYPSPEARERAMGTGMKRGIGTSFDRLAALLGTIA